MNRETMFAWLVVAAFTASWTLPAIIGWFVERVKTSCDGCDDEKCTDCFEDE